MTSPSEHRFIDEDPVCAKCGFTAEEAAAWKRTSGLRAYADNVILVLDPPAAETASGLALVHTRAPGAREHRTARVIASGPGFRRPCCGAFVANTVKAGDRVVVDAIAGQNFDMDLHAPRFNKSAQFEELFGERANFRIVREEEILAVIEEDVAVAAE